MSDTFLDGKVRVTQPDSGFRAGLDAVMLAAAVPARAGERALELGSGAGTASLCLQARVRELAVTGVEIDPWLAAMANDNAAANGMSACFFAVDAFDLPPELKSDFDQVFCNPPFHGEGAVSPDPDRAAALMDGGMLTDWLKVGLQRTVSGGFFTAILRADRLAEAPAELSPVVPLDPISLQLGYGLIPLVDKDKGADLLERITRIRKESALDMGLVVPRIRIIDNMRLEPSEYNFKIKGVPGGRGVIQHHDRIGHPGDDVLSRAVGVDRPEVPGREVGGVEARVDPGPLEGHGVALGGADHADPPVGQLLGPRLVGQVGDPQPGVRAMAGDGQRQIAGAAAHVDDDGRAGHRADDGDGAAAEQFGFAARDQHVWRQGQIDAEKPARRRDWSV